MNNEEILKNVKRKFALNVEQITQLKPIILFVIKSKADEDKIFIQHIQDHLDKEERGLKLYKIPAGKVGCAICGKTAEEIIKEKQNE